MGDDEQLLARLERVSPWLFLAGGVLVIGFAAVEAYGVVVANDPVQFPEYRSAFLSGYALGFIGLIGVYHRLADRSPWLARLGGSMAALGAIGFSLAVVLSVGRLVGIAPARESMPPWFALVFGLLPVLGFLIGYLSLGVGALRSDAYPRTVGMLLLFPSILFALNIALAVIELSVWSSPVIATGEAIVIFSIGYSLRTEAPSRGMADSMKTTA